MAKLFITSIADNIVFKWVLFSAKGIKTVKHENNGVCIIFHRYEDAFETYKALYLQTDEEEAQYKLEITNY